MAKFTRLEVVNQMEKSGIIPLFYHDEYRTAKNAIEAIYHGGARILEFTNRGEFAHEIFSQLVKFIRRELPDMMIGAGSVIDAGTTSLFLQSGADFIVSPILNEEMAHVCNQQNVLWSPGCGTLTEIIKGNQLGADIVKIFPASQLEPGFIKAVGGPCPWLKLMPTGGINQQNLSAWIKAGATCVGMGSGLIKKEFLEDDRLNELSKHVTSMMELFQSIKTG